MHETLSLSSDEVVEFDGIVDRVAFGATEVAATDARVTIKREGSFGVLGAEIATPLVMVLNELLLNAVEHGFAQGSGGAVTVHAQRVAKQLRVSVVDTGRGPARGFRPGPQRAAGAADRPYPGRR